MTAMTRLPSVSQHSRQQLSSPRHRGGTVGAGWTRNNSQCLWEMHSGHLHRWERAKKQSPERQGNVFVLSAGLPSSLLPLGLQAP